MRVTFIVFTLACLCCVHGVPSLMPPRTTAESEQMATSSSTPTDKPVISTDKGGKAATAKEKEEGKDGGNAGTTADEKTNDEEVTKDENIMDADGVKSVGDVKTGGVKDEGASKVNGTSTEGDPKDSKANDRTELGVVPKSETGAKAEGTRSPVTKVDGGNSKADNKTDSKTDTKVVNPDNKETKKPAESNEEPADNEGKGAELPVDNKQAQTTKASPVEQTTIKVGGTTKEEEDEDDEYIEDVEGVENAIGERNEKSDSVQEPPSGRQNHPSVPGDEAESSHFFAYLVSTAVLVAVLYIGYHNKRKIIAYVVEGRRSRSSRRPKGTEYQKLQQSM
ncbi:trans-Golgi network integral membrane protein TGN38 [Megalops cyprinoides]|uniref:trans-Golgi network integral membrane protein TGN38 n=1 Tax=Megalops cyprinoides TaxID=118141 RepID=UPI001864005E|nr:trans-Golgi network integral membrane protein TGN38 [Megalops cyprinoides]